MNYRGRFAPSPSGPLHFGSLVAAMGSYLDAKHHKGTWLVRIEDIDPPREKPGAADQILRTLETFGFEWDESVLYQSKRLNAYQDALHELARDGLLYECTCSRSEINAIGQRGIEGIIYPGTCRTYSPGSSVSNTPKALRIKTSEHPIQFRDGLAGSQTQNIAKEIGDFILKRADGLFAYQLAVVMDDAYQNITHVVRGADLLTSTPRQIYLQMQLHLPTPSYTHLPLVLNEDGTKLSKQSGSQPVTGSTVMTALKSAWDFLGQIDTSTSPESVAEFWTWAMDNWDTGSIKYNK
ncbi:tRNA glutamyl-Q(34) synthetase GluQRS [Sedimenticola selenatireducens]|uniref:Glutamyl-Q tRNA(Asp) synthetase n=1 Tax=Sedimenticola selenatireducens TaxID=191960 RepID=A0A558DQ10_9GAMM|nr:tRNA glutamyl-Q(34) synthetase GluQRS [Sedimenticola selenatireducens]TVO70552.1 tRNA glutamyl-Q(34) synthetase GluQRS [Sedimenticola selenatireducens]TVT63129.1 MAG: tRNA glutamyl-Q(34) synthetase GluQRS [Sedimenticola selenatireducens]